jgi:hypothetical protein
MFDEADDLLINQENYYQAVSFQISLNILDLGNNCTYKY